MEYNIKIPDDFFSVFKFLQEEKLGIAAINTGLRGFKSKIVFGWHLSLMLHFDNVKEDGLPNDSDHKKVEIFEDELSDLLNPEKRKPNGVFLGRITWNRTAELIWRIHDPEGANNIVQDVLRKKLYPFPFDYRMDPDADWNLASWHLEEREYELNKN